MIGWSVRIPVGMISWVRLAFCSCFDEQSSLRADSGNGTMSKQRITYIAVPTNMGQMKRGE
eukprot:1013823-Amphidinium_carterae.1